MKRRPHKRRQSHGLERLEDRCLMSATPVQSVHGSSDSTVSNVPAVESAGLAGGYGNIPLSFELNRGQASAAVDFLARGPAYSVLLSGGGAELMISDGGEGRLPASLHMKLVGVASVVPATGQSPLLGEPPPPPPTGAVPSVSFQIPRSAGLESIGSTNFAVVLSRASDRTVTVDYSVTGGTAGADDFFLFGSSLTFAPGEMVKNFPAAIVDDLLDEPNETFTLALSNPTNAMLGKRKTHTHTIIDNDEPPTVTFRSAESTASEGVTQPSIDVVLSAASGQVVTVGVKAIRGAARSGADFTLTSRTISFNPGETTKSVPIYILDDSTSEPTETIKVKLSKPRGARLTTVPQQHTCSITDNDGDVQAAVFARTLGSQSETLQADRATAGWSGDPFISARRVRRTR